jgi:ABC-type branched-subunit amino acid transport system substrate-binding protein
MRRFAISTVAGVAVVASALTLAGCGSSNNLSSSSPSSVSGANSATAVATSAGTAHGKPITILGFGPINVPVVSAPGVQRGFQIAADAINNAGGVDGRPLNLLFCNDQFQASIRAGCVRTGQSAGAVAAYSNSCYTACQNLNTAGLPFINAVSQPQDASLTNEFPWSNGATGSAIALPFALKRAGAHKVAVVAIDLPPGVAKGQLEAQAAKRAGLQVAGTVLFPATTTDYSPFAEKVKQSGADSVMFVAGLAEVTSAIGAMQALGLNLKYGTFEPSLTTAVANTLGAAGKEIVTASMVPPATATTIPAIKQFISEAKAAGVTNSAEWDSWTIWSWATAHAIANALEKVKGTITAASFLKTLQTWPAGTTIDVAGLTKWDPSAKGSSADGAARAGNGAQWLTTYANGNQELLQQAPLDSWQAIGAAPAGSQG